MFRFRPLRAMLIILALFSGCLATMGLRSAESGKPADKTLAPYFMVLSDEPDKDVMPLKSSQADVKIAGLATEVKVTQVYKNTGKKTLEAIYVFPASSRAAVHAMRMTIGERVIDAEIMERQKARETYEAAKKEGKTTSLLEQQRPNVFQMNVANILPGDEIKVELNYMELLQAEDNIYEFVYPTVVGPRYTTKTASGAPDTDKWVQNPYLHEGEAPPYTFGLNVELSSGLPITKLASPSHEVEIKYSGQNAAQVKIKDEKTAGNRDFVLRYALAGDKIDSGLLLYPGKDENFFLLMMEPPAKVAAKAVLPREYVFIVDISGSMYGFPLETSKTLMQEVIQGLRPQDFLNVVLFASGQSILAPGGSLPASAENKQKALDFIKSQPGGGGTNIVPAMSQALGLPHTEGVSRIVAVATDGYVDVEPQVFQLIRDNLKSANLFAFGIGTAVNRHLIEGMARAGQGESFVVLNPGEAAKQAARFRNYIASPVLTDIKVSYEGFQAYDVEPAAAPDLFALRPLAILGKYRGNPTGTVVVKGKTAQGPFERRIDLSEAKSSPDNAALRFLWARQRIMGLVDFSNFDPSNKDLEKQVVALGLKYSLMSPFTSFVAVDKVKRADGTLVTVKQPLPLPQGVSDLALGEGGAAAPMALMPGSRGYGAKYMPETAWVRKKSGPHGYNVASAGPGGAAPGETGTAAGPAVTVTVKNVQIDGALPAAEVRQVLNNAAAQLSRCCQDAVKTGYQLPAEITLVFTVGPDGKIVGEPAGKPPLANQGFESCLSQTLKALEFPKAQKAPAQVTVKLALSVK
ncbi:MAG: AgmX/PglI C-terminal domain-containing protein [Deltaproteobacteria bacterium]|nr:AgmX/PglI C-terminal domain-containing protein [Deltaproteobacteria bacterium]